MGDVNQSLQFSDTDEAPPTPTVALTMSSLSAGQWEWLSDTPSLLPPHSNAESYYSHFGRTVGFTSGAGRRFRGALDEHLQMLRWPEGMKKDKELSIRGEDGCLYHWILPSFFQLLKDLTQEGLDFAVVFRTFGTDLPRVLRAMSRVLQEGLHPLFPDLPELKVFLDPGGSETRTACTSELFDIALIQNDLLRAISDRSYFTQRVHICMENYDRNLQQGAG